MKNKTRRFLNRRWDRKGVHVAKTTPALDVQQLVELLVPIDSGIELIRIGGDYDGGYLVPDDLEGIKYCFSPGVDVTATFELDCLARGIPSFLADHSVDAPPVDLPGCTFTKKFIGAAIDDKTMTLDHWVDESLKSDDDSELILQMDIEGAEYETLLATPRETLRRFRIIVIEIHFMEALRDRMFFNIARATFRRIREDFEIVHVHTNNCCGVTSIDGVAMPQIFEMTLLRKDRAKSRAPVKNLPHPLDQLNMPELPEMTALGQWPLGR